MTSAQLTGLLQIYSDGSEQLQELKKDSSDFSFFYILKIYFAFFDGLLAGFCYDVRKNNHIFEGLI